MATRRFFVIACILSFLGLLLGIYSTIQSEICTINARKFSVLTGSSSSGMLDSNNKIFECLIKIEGLLLVIFVIAIFAMAKLRTQMNFKKPLLVNASHQSKVKTKKFLCLIIFCCAGIALVYGIQANNYSSYCKFIIDGAVSVSGNEDVSYVSGNLNAANDAVSVSLHILEVCISVVLIISVAAFIKLRTRDVS